MGNQGVNVNLKNRRSMDGAPSSPEDLLVEPLPVLRQFTRESPSIIRKDEANEEATQFEPLKSMPATLNSSSSKVVPLRRALSFTLVAKCGRARHTILKLPHGLVETPVFMAVGTQGSVKGLTSEQVRMNLWVCRGPLDSANCAFLFLFDVHCFLLQCDWITFCLSIVQVAAIGYQIILGNT